MKAACFLGAFALVLSAATAAQAVLITNTSSSTVVFSDDFENQTAGAAQTTANMNSGAAGSSWSNVGVNQSVVDNAGVPVPGAFQGTQYLRADRSAGGNGASGRSNANFTAPLAGETVEIEFAYNVGVGGLAFQFLGADNSIIWNTQASGAGGLWEFYDSSGVLNTTATTLTGGATGAWHTAKYTYTQGSTDLTLAIDGVSELISGAVSASDALKFPSAAALGVNSGSTAYYDAVPEPSALLLAGFGMIALVGLRFRNRKCS